MDSDASIEIIVKQLAGISEDIKQLPRILAQMETMNAAQKRLEDLLTRSVENLQRTDVELSKELQALIITVHGNATSISVLSSAVKDIETDIKSIEASKSETHKKFYNFINQWSPWLKSIKWVVITGGAVVVVVIVYAVFWAITQSGSGLP